MQMIGQFLGFLGAMAQNDPIAAAILVVALLIVPSTVTFDALWRVYWLGWWCTAAALTVSTHRREPLGLGGALSRSAAALLAKPSQQRVVVTKFAAAGGMPAAPSDIPADGSPAGSTGNGQTPEEPGSAPRGPSAADAFRERVKAVAAAFKDEPASGGLAVGGASVAWTGARRTTEDERAEEVEKILGLGDALCSRIQGQDHALRAIAQALVNHATGVRDSRNKPVLSVLMAGPTGVGKTETAKALAELAARPLLTYDMGNFAQEHTVSGLIGSPPGYSGSNKPGRLVADIDTHPNALVLLDEIEKAHPLVFDPLLAALDEARLKDIAQGQVADCNNVIFIMTTNLLAQQAIQDPTIADDDKAIKTMLLNEKFLRPELIGRVDLCLLYRLLSREVMGGIAEAMLDGYVRGVIDRQGGRLEHVEIDHAVIDLLLDRCDLKFGVRDLKGSMQSALGGAITQAYLPYLRRREHPTTLRLRAVGKAITAEYAA